MLTYLTALQQLIANGITMQDIVAKMRVQYPDIPSNIIIAKTKQIIGDK